MAVDEYEAYGSKIDINVYMRLPCEPGTNDLEPQNNNQRGANVSKEINKTHVGERSTESYNHTMLPMIEEELAKNKRNPERTICSDIFRYAKYNKEIPLEETEFTINEHRPKGAKQWKENNQCHMRYASKLLCYLLGDSARQVVTRCVNWKLESQCQMKAPTFRLVLPKDGFENEETEREIYNKINDEMKKQNESPKVEQIRAIEEVGDKYILGVEPFIRSS